MASGRLFSLSLFFLLFYGTHCCVLGQKLDTGPQVLTFFSDVDDTEQPYGLYLPNNYDSGKKYPLVIMLHGAGSNHRLALRRVFGKSNFEGENDVEASRYFPEWEDVEYIVASPYARGTAGYQGIPEKDVYDVLEDVKRRFSIDERRIYLTGLSMGGGGTLWLGMTRPDIWAAIAPVCPAPPAGTEELATNAFNLPVHLFHGADDPVVPVLVAREWEERLTALGIVVAYQEYPGVQHDSWVNAYKDASIFKWFDQFEKEPFPDEVRYTTRQYKYNKAFWVSLDELTPGALATIEASFTAPNAIHIITSELTAFSLDLEGHPKFNKKDQVQLIVDGKKLQTKTQGTISLSYKNGRWKLEAFEPAAGMKQKGLEGPIKEGFADRHVYVYGTLDNPGDEVLAERMALANEAADWSVNRGAFLGRYMVFPRVVSDKELRPSDISDANLILFGTKETNEVIAQLGSELPLHLDPKAEDVGLCYIYPVNDRYVVVNSGLPWWNEAQSAFRFLPQKLAVLPEFKDYVLFRGSKDEKISEGYFNKNWELSETAKKELLESGLIIAH